MTVFWKSFEEVKEVLSGPCSRRIKKGERGVRLKVQRRGSHPKKGAGEKTLGRNVEFS